LAALTPLTDKGVLLVQLERHQEVGIDSIDEFWSQFAVDLRGEKGKIPRLVEAVNVIGVKVGKKMEKRLFVIVPVVDRGGALANDGPVAEGLFVRNMMTMTRELMLRMANVLAK
jgi:hypothetical protein